MGTTTIRDANPYLYTDPDNPFALPESILKEGRYFLTEQVTTSLVGIPVFLLLTTMYSMIHTS